MEYFFIFIAGIAGSFHCIGMCGGFACALSPDPHKPTTTVQRHLIYNSGRLMTYVFIGAIAGTLGAEVVTFSLAPRILAMASGILILLMGMQLLGYLPSLKRIAVNSAGAKILIQDLRGILKTPGHRAPLAFGVVNGFLPCPLVYAFALQAVASGTALSGLLTMAAFGLGTFPAMLLMGGLGRLLQPVWRHRGVQLAGIFIILLGLITLARGLAPLTGHSH